MRCTGLRVGRARLWLNLTILHVVWCAAASSFSSCGVCHQWINGLLSADLFFFSLFLSLSFLKKCWLVFVGIYDLVIFFLIFYFCPWLFNKSFISFQFSPSILICNKLCFSIGLFFISYFFTWPLYIYIYIYIYIYFQFQHPIQVYFVLLFSIWSSIFFFFC